MGYLLAALLFGWASMVSAQSTSPMTILPPVSPPIFVHPTPSGTTVLPGAGAPLFISPSLSAGAPMTILPPVSAPIFVYPGSVR